MAAVSLFWNSNMAAVTSCEYALLLAKGITDRLRLRPKRSGYEIVFKPDFESSGTLCSGGSGIPCHVHETGNNNTNPTQELFGKGDCKDGLIKRRRNFDWCATKLPNLSNQTKTIKQGERRRFSSL